ncbi:MAG: DUF1768 domain-containing protein, partial [Solobacterium sp.]|nr:DUF1768 domain-containing protein [Solobacterium sp.]
GRTYSSMEQYVMYQKAECFHDGAIGVTIMETEDPEKIRALGRMVFGYDEHVWNGVRQLIVYDGLIAKFTQNEELHETEGNRNEIHREVFRKRSLLGNRCRT